jgi:hypothetical protein
MNFVEKKRRKIEAKNTLHQLFLKKKTNKHSLAFPVNITSDTLKNTFH